MLLNEAWNFYRDTSEEEEEMKYSGLVKFFSENSSPTEEQIHEMAEKMNISEAELEERIFALLSSILKGVGKNNNVPDEDFDKEQLLKGIKIELEHTNDKLVSKMIAKDHLAEIPDYYTRLERMEDQAKEDGSYNEPETSENKFSIRDELTPKLAAPEEESY